MFDSRWPRSIELLSGKLLSIIRTYIFIHFIFFLCLKNSNMIDISREEKMYWINLTESYWFQGHIFNNLLADLILLSAPKLQWNLNAISMDYQDRVHIREITYSTDYLCFRMQQLLIYIYMCLNRRLIQHETLSGKRILTYNGINDTLYVETLCLQCATRGKKKKTTIVGPWDMIYIVLFLTWY